MTRIAALTLTLALAAFALPRPADAQETLPPGTLIAEAIAADLPEAGLDYVVSNFTGLIPPDLVIGSIPTQEIFEIPWVCTEDVWIDNLVVHTEITSITSDGQSPATYPPDGALVVNVNLTLSINDPSDTATLYLDGCIDYVCNMHTTPADVTLSLPVTLKISQDANGDDFVDIVFGELAQNIEAAMQGAIFLTGCAVGDIDAWLNTNLGFSVFDLIIGQFIGEIESQVADALVDLEATGEEALQALWLEDSTDILDTELTYELHPNEVDHNDDGMRLVMAGRTMTEPHPCVADFAGDGSPFTDAAMPGMTPSVPSNNAVYHLGALLADDFANQAMWNLWNGGVLCYIVRDGDVSGFAIDTTLFGLLGGQDNPELFEQFFPFGPAPMVIRTLPETPPLVTFDGPNDINVQIEALNVQFAPLILDRFTNLVTVAIDIDAGVDISVAPDGALALDIFLDTENLNPRVTYNELDPDSNGIVEGNFGTLVGAVINLVAGDLLEGMKIALPVFGAASGDDDDSATGDDDDSALGDDDDSAGPPLGLGAVQMDIEAVGLSSSLLDFMGAYVLLGESWGGESVGGCGDCGGEGGCGDCGGEGGCGDCGDLAGCDIQEELSGSGCTGETSGQPDDLGCQGCRLGHGVHRVAANHWRIEIDGHGTSIAPHPHRHRSRGLHPVTMLLVLIPVAFMRRRR
ncbi:MAG: hypothetical protein KDA24_24945 [Deltaproteobacteria bacterium]|nr:hypothetical protein [Deltaproteobacteria bacterium]